LQPIRRYVRQSGQDLGRRNANINFRMSAVHGHERQNTFDDIYWGRPSTSGSSRTF
jgi:hypothetical protein